MLRSNGLGFVKVGNVVVVALLILALLAPGLGGALANIWMSSSGYSATKDWTEGATVNHGMVYPQRAGMYNRAIPDFANGRPQCPPGGKLEPIGARQAFDFQSGQHEIVVGYWCIFDGGEKDLIERIYRWVGRGDPPNLPPLAPVQ